MINEFERIFGQWRQSIQKHIDEAESVNKDEKGIGPKKELEYWKSRMRAYTGISE